MTVDAKASVVACRLYGYYQFIDGPFGRQNELD